MIKHEGDAFDNGSRLTRVQMRRAAVIGAVRREDGSLSGPAGGRWGRAVAAVLATGLLSGPVPGIAAAAGDSDVAAGLRSCSGIEAAEARLACFDALAARSAAAGEAAAAPPGPLPMTVGTARVRSGGRDEDGPHPALAASRQRPVLGILPYRSNYLLPVTYNDNVNPYPVEDRNTNRPLFGEDVFEDLEVKFQISFEVPLWTNLLNRPLDLYFGYTQLAFFQAYNKEYSSPFRETNYEPELGLHWQPDLRIGLGGSRWRLSSVRVAANHQSNGRSQPLSRSWNRLTGEAWMSRGDLSLGLRLWTLLGTSPSDNPDITEYLGYGELRGRYELGKQRFEIMLRSLRHPTVQLDWSYPLTERVSLYVQYFNGYGESLIDYDHSVNRIGAGFMFGANR